MTSALRRVVTRSSVAFGTTVLTVSAIGIGVARAAPPTIASFEPASGPVGTSVEIDGTGFNDSSQVTAVKFNGTSASFTVDSNSEISATVPTGATTGPIAVTDSEGTATSSTNFTVTAGAAPTITSFDPTSGPVGTSVVIRGTGFTGATAVKFHGTSASFTVNSNTRITATVPTGATTGRIAVTTPGGTATSSTNFTVTTGAAPTITSFDPTSGPVGTSVVIRGTGFTGATAVRFAGTSAGFTVNSNTRITATVPTGATTGRIAVTTPGGTATSSTNFTVTTVVRTHARTITLNLSRHLVALGSVTAADGFDACESGVEVKIQRWRDGRWRTVDSSRTIADGVFREGLRDRPGLYRAVALREELNAGADVCPRDRSPRVRHRH